MYLKDIGSSSGTFLNKMRLSPATKVSRPYPIREGDIIQLGVDYQGRTEGLQFIIDNNWLEYLQNRHVNNNNRDAFLNRHLQSS